MGTLMRLKALIWKNTVLYFRSFKKVASVFGITFGFCLSLTLVREMSVTEESKQFKPHVIRNFKGKYLTVPFTPVTDATEQIMSYVSYCCQVYHNTKCTPIGFTSPEEAYKRLQLEMEQLDQYTPVIAFLVDPDKTDVPKNLPFRILIYTNIIINDLHKQEDDPYNPYEKDAILECMLLITNCFVKHWFHGDWTRFQLRTVKIPTVDYKWDKLENHMLFLPLSLLLLFDVTNIVVCQIVCYEKKKGIKESLKYMGVSSGLYWFSCVVTGLIFHQVPSLGIFITMMMSSYYKYVNPFCLYFCITLFSFNSLALVLVISAIVRHAFRATLTFFTLHILLYKAVAIVELQMTTRLSMCIFRCLAPVSAFREVFRKLMVEEIIAVGYDYTKLHHISIAATEDTLLENIVTLVLNTVFTLILLWYVDNVFPGKFGKAQPMDFCFRVNYWLPNRQVSKDSKFLPPPVDKVFFENQPFGAIVGVTLKGLTKVYGNKVVVANLNLDFYKNRITVILGLPGSGKSSITAMIAGTVTPTRGTILINGKDHMTFADQAGKIVAFCPKHDIYYERLQCSEHIKFYCWLRGASRDRTEIYRVMKTIGLHTDINTEARLLSKSQIKNLSVVGAFIGGSDVIVMDEPTALLDPPAKKRLWTFLKNMHHNRTILLTTQFMDEPQYIGFQTAILYDGVVKCCGSIEFLKRIYGIGYELTIVERDKCNFEALTELIATFVPTALYKGRENGEITYLLQENYLFGFPALLTTLEEQGDMLSIEFFDLRVIKPEDVFLKIAQGYQPEINLWSRGLSSEISLSDNVVRKLATKNISRQVYEAPVPEIHDDNYQLNKGFILYGQRMTAILYKKAMLAKRSWLSKILILIVFPALLTFYGLSADSSSVQPWLNYSLNVFQNATIVAFCGTKNSRLGEIYNEQVTKPHTYLYISNKEEDINICPSYLQNEGKSIGSVNYLNQFLIAADMEAKGDQSKDASVKGDAYYHQYVYHSIGISTQLVLNTYVKFRLGDEFSIDTGIGILHQEGVDTVRSVMTTTAFSIMVAMSIVPVVFIYELITERQNGARHLQEIAGAGSLTYWIPTLIFDYRVYNITVCTIMVTSLYYPETMAKDDRLIVSLIIFYWFGLAMLINAYLLQKLFHAPAYGMALMLSINLILGMLIGMWMRKLKNDYNSIWLDLAHYSLLVLSPHYNLLWCLLDYLNLSLHLDKGKSFTFFFENKNFLLEIVTLCVQPFLYGFLLYLTECNLYRKMWYTQGAKVEADEIKAYLGIYEADEEVAEDSDIVNETRRISHHPLKTVRGDFVRHCAGISGAVIMRNLTKVYREKVAINRLCLMIQRNELFCLLGHSASGKSTLMQMLTGHTTVSGGDAFVLGKSIRGPIREVQAVISYCPKNNALMEYLTGRETLLLYGRLRGIPEYELLDQVERIFELFLMAKYADTLVRDYSIVLKRQLSVAISLIGKPKIIILNQPTIGMHTLAKDRLMKVLRQIHRSGKTIVLATSSLEECQTLCTTMAIMVAGKIKCFGSLKYLKNKFTRSFELILKVASTEESEYPLDMDELIKHVTSILPGAVHQATGQEMNYIQFHVPQLELRLSYVFAEMERTKKMFHLEKYTVYQTTLGHVFTASQEEFYTGRARQFLCLS